MSMSDEDCCCVALCCLVLGRWFGVEDRVEFQRSDLSARTFFWVPIKTLEAAPVIPNLGWKVEQRGR